MHVFFHVQEMLQFILLRHLLFYRTLYPDITTRGSFKNKLFNVTLTTRMIHEYEHFLQN